MKFYTSLRAFFVLACFLCLCKGFTLLPRMVSRNIANHLAARTDEGVDVLERIFEKLNLLADEQADQKRTLTDQTKTLHLLADEQADQKRALAEQRRTLDRLERANADFLESRVRDVAGKTFGEKTVSRFIAQSLYDLAVLASPHDISSEQQMEVVEKLQVFVVDNYVRFAQAYYEHLCTTIADSSLLTSHPWVVNGSVVLENVKACSRDLNKSQQRIQQRIAIVADKSSGGGRGASLLQAMNLFQRSTGPGFSILVWSACGKFVNELELDCRGKVELIVAANKAIVTGAEVKTSASAISKAKKQLKRTFHVIAKCLEITHGIRKEDCIFVGRVFFKEVSPNASVLESEYESRQDSEFECLSFYYHRV